MMSSLSPEQIHVGIKITAAVAIATALDKYALGHVNLNESLIFGASVGAGVGLGDLVGGSFSLVLPDASNAYLSSKSIIHRSVEVASGVGSAYLINKYFMKNDYDPSEMYKKLGVIALTSIASEAVADFYTGNSISYE